jgi:hypothetical protein
VIDVLTLRQFATQGIAKDVALVTHRLPDCLTTKKVSIVLSVKISNRNSATNAKSVPIAVLVGWIKCPPAHKIVLAIFGNSCIISHMRVTIVVEITADVPEGTVLDDVSVEFPAGVHINEGTKREPIGEYINHGTETVFAE